MGGMLPRTTMSYRFLSNVHEYSQTQVVLTFVKNQQSQLAHTNEAMAQCIEKDLMRRQNDASVEEYSIPYTLLSPMIDIVSPTQKLNAISRKVGLEDLILLFTQDNSWCEKPHKLRVIR